MTTPGTALDLEAITARAEGSPDIPLLVEEVRRLCDEYMRLTKERAEAWSEIDRLRALVSKEAP